MHERRVCITGLGAVTPLDQGEGVISFWRELLNGTNAIKPLTSVNTEGFYCRVGGEISELSDFLKDDFWFGRGRCARLFALSVQEAVFDSKIKNIPSRVGVAFGSILFEINIGQKYLKNFIYEEKGKDVVLLRGYSPQNIPALVAEYYGFNGPNYAINTACSSSSDAIGLAANEIRMGRADVMLAGGADQISDMLYRGFCALGALTKDGKVRPFDVDRTGTAVSEGAGVVVLESLTHARARNAKIYCELAGMGTNAEAYNLVKPRADGTGLCAAMKAALMESGMRPCEVDYICAHGTGTIHNDRAEGNAIKLCFGDYAKDLKISSIKSMIGHTMGASAVLGAIATIKAMETSNISPTINHEESEDGCGFDFVPDRSCKAVVNVGFTLSAGFGGQNSALLFRKERK